MIPGKYDIEIYQGDSFGPLRLTLPSLASFGGPSDLTNATVAAHRSVPKRARMSCWRTLRSSTSTAPRAR